MAADRAECERIFKRFDVNGDGKISLAEFADALKVLGLTSQEEVQRRMAEIDKDGDGFITLEELIEFHTTSPNLMKDVLKKL
ncbi:polcalcin Cyn d 7-like [Lotus japonicus]|uniref:polcalcin Cyn d 7-like n=1 Tax=Lotus japonicus TaxID=34305 RepID=UPI0025911BC4|nr:polcalcin Cyn d 7-like [Lotus japonicus]